MRVEFGQRKWEIKPEKPAGGSYKPGLQLKGGMAKCLEERGGHKMLTGQWLGGNYTKKGEPRPSRRGADDQGSPSPHPGAGLDAVTEP